VHEVRHRHEQRRCERVTGDGRPVDDPARDERDEHDHREDERDGTISLRAMSSAPPMVSSARTRGSITVGAGILKSRNAWSSQWWPTGLKVRSDDLA